MPATTVEPKTALILGSTGAVGKHLLRALLSQSSFHSVHAFVRPSSSITPPPAVSPGKVFVQHALDFDKLLAGDESEAAKLRDVKADVIYITLGTTRADAGSAHSFEQIDRQYVLAAVKVAASFPAATQRIVHCSSQAANSNSYFLYPRSKGLLEQGLANLATDVIICRPGFLAQADRSRLRLAETIFGKVTGAASYLTDSLQIPVSTLGMAMMKAGQLGSAGLSSLRVGSPPSKSFKRDESLDNTVTILSNAEALQLGKA